MELSFSGLYTKMPRSKAMFAPLASQSQRPSPILTPVPQTPIPQTPIPQTPTQQSPTFLQTMKEGAAFGVGSTFARMMIEKTMGVHPPSRIEHEPCYTERRVYEMCSSSENIICDRERSYYDECIKVTERTHK